MGVSVPEQLVFFGTEPGNIITVFWSFYSVRLYGGNVEVRIMVKVRKIPAW